ncbi:MAG: alpha/beta hydrolase [Muribaculaceae bacterium]|nr:alpha/beta hydrolase [Roseburia sp.]MCM1432137.1 alpha/beta hydrolase [Muribaculaceae bacterium]MCM1493644.1 alpha/beta hydrolase [Muribaculaceae bacterium]MCM1560197.1 alpha/beta hydrolase [Butyrivibrio sp.]
MEEVTLKAEDGYELSLHVFAADGARGCVQIIHGMEEHKERYDGFAEKLVEAGFSVVSSDMRGHGKNAPVLGFFKEKDGYRYLLSDQKRITAYAKERFGVKKVYIFAHSMGTIIARNLLQTESGDYKKVVLSGFPCSPGRPAIDVAVGLSRLITALRGPAYDSKLVAYLGTGSFNKAIKHPKTKLDWLSYNEDNIRAYQADKYCGHGFKVSAYLDLFTLVRRMSCPKCYRRVNERLPIFLIRGDGDPCTGFAKGASASVRTLKKAGFHSIRTKTYRHMRHELLNEAGAELVTADIIRFLK